MNELINGKTMTVRQIAEVLGISERTVQLKAKELFPEIIQERETSYFNEIEVTAIKNACEKKFAVVTQRDKIETIQKAQSYLAEMVEDLQKKIAEDAPKVEFFEAVTNSEDCLSVGDVAKILNMGMGQNKLFRFLRDNHIFMENNQPYQRFIDQGYFRLVEQSYKTPDGTVHINYKPVVYQTGVSFIRTLINKKQPAKITNRVSI